MRSSLRSMMKTTGCPSPPSCHKRRWSWTLYSFSWTSSSAHSFILCKKTSQRVKTTRLSEANLPPVTPNFVLAKPTQTEQGPRSTSTQRKVSVSSLQKMPIRRRGRVEAAISKGKEWRRLDFLKQTYRQFHIRYYPHIPFPFCFPSLSDKILSPYLFAFLFPVVIEQLFSFEITFSSTRSGSLSEVFIFLELVI